LKLFLESLSFLLVPAVDQPIVSKSELNADVALPFMDPSETSA
jgi:hypothetical protein